MLCNAMMFTTPELEDNNIKTCFLWLLSSTPLHKREAYLEPSQVSTVELFAKIVNNIPTKIIIKP